MLTGQPPKDIVAIIPARGGSKGIPRKNVRPLAGKPLLAYSVEAARGTPAIGTVVVSTDDREIGQVAEAYGAEVVWRPAEISGDTASSESALLHALDELRAQRGHDPDLVVFLQATSPLRAPTDIQLSIETLVREQADSLFSAAPAGGFAWRVKSGDVTPVNYDPVHRPRRQELDEHIILENGSIYVFKPWVLRQLNSRLGGKIATHMMAALDSFEIDEPDDFRRLEELSRLSRQPADRSQLGQIALLVLDFDGVLTDNRVLVDETGQEAVWCHRGDGWGIARLKEAGVEVVVVSTEANPVVAARCRKLNIPCVQDCPDKLAAVEELARQRALSADRIAYVGNDVNDRTCLQWVGIPIAVADAQSEIQQMAHFVTTCRGGAGAVREVADWILVAKEQNVRRQ